VVAAVHQVAPDKPLHTFTTGFDPDDEAVADAQVVARHFGTRHHESYLTPDAVPALLPRVLWHMEDPIGREEELFLQVIAAEAAKHVPVLLMGENADSLFTGMPRHMVANVAAKVGLGAGPLEDFYRYTQSGRLPTSLFGKTLVALYYRGQAVPAPRVLGAATMPESAGLDRGAAQQLNELLRRSLLGAPNAYAALERICGGAGLAFNAPYFDGDLVQCALQIPDRLKIRGRQQKYILRLACRSLLPDAIAQRKKVMPRLRHDRALCDVLDRLADDLLAPQVVKSRGLFDPAQVDRARRRPSSGIYGTDQFYRLWTLLLTELWARLFLDGRGARPS
jgi:asparagine synthase (glutamine-hydrolysing)